MPDSYQAKGWLIGSTIHLPVSPLPPSFSCPLFALFSCILNALFFSMHTSCATIELSLACMRSQSSSSVPRHTLCLFALNYWFNHSKATRDIGAPMPSSCLLSALQLMAFSPSSLEHTLLECVVFITSNTRSQATNL